MFTKHRSPLQKAVLWSLSLNNENDLPFDPLSDEEQRMQLEREDAGMQFSHSLEEQIGGQLAAGFRLIDLYEDTNGEGRLHELNIPTFLALCSMK